MRWHPIWLFLVFLLLCRGLGDFYPFNKFPMYANPADETSDFIIVTDADGKPLPMEKLTGESSPKIKKKYTAVRNDLAAAAGIKDAANGCPPEICQQAMQKVAEMLWRLAAKKKQTLPDVLTMQQVKLYQEATGFRETTEELGRAHRKR
jgi:hypothetical protein